METTKKLSLDDIFGKASAPASSEAVKSIDDIFGQKEAATPVAPYGTMTDEIRGVSHAPADLIGVSPQPAIIGENELQKNRAGFEEELKSMAGAIQPTQESFKPMSADAFKVGGDVTMPGDIDKPKSLSQTVQSEIDKRWGGNLQSIIDKARSVNPENVNLAEDMESHFWEVMKDKVPSDSFITQEDLDGFKFTRDYSNGDKDIEYSFGHYTYPQEVVNEYVARHNDEVLHNMRFKEEPEYRNEWFLRNVGVTEQAYRDEVAADLENRLQELRKKVVATLPAQHTRSGYAAIGAAANKPSSGASVSIEKIDKALKTVNTLRKNSFGAGLKEGFDFADILTLGVSGIGENVALLNALNKSASGKNLTTSEQALVEAWDIQNEAEEVMQVLGGRSLASNIGRGGAQSLGFITQTVGTGGLASAATKGITRAAAKSALKRVASTGVASKIQEGVRYGSLKAAESLVGAAARTPFMGFTYRNYTDKRLNQFQINERVDEATGEISKYIDKQESSALRDAAHAALESYFESQSEDVGGLIDFGITSFARALPIKQFIRSSVVNGMTGAVKNGAMKWIKESAKIYGLAGEVLSEAYGDAAVNLLTSNTDGWKQMASSEYWWELLGVSSMLSGGFGVVNRAVNSYSGRNLDRQIAREDNNRRNALSRIEDDILKKELTEVSLTDDLIERSKMLSSLDWSNFTKEDMANTIDFISAQTRLDVMRESDMESRRLARIMPAIDEVKTLADNGALDEDQAAASLAVIYSDLFRTQENQRALNILTDRIKVAADSGISADEINDILRGAGLTVFNPGDEIETLTGDRAIVDKVLPGAYEVVNNEGDRAVVSFEEVLQNTPEVRQIQQESNQTEGQAESAPENNPQVEQAVESARQEADAIKNLDDDVIYEATLSDGTPVNIIKGANIVYNNQTGEVDYDASDATVVVRSNDGNKRQISIREIDSIDQAMSVDEAMEVATAAATEVVNSQEQAETPTAEVVSTQDEVPSVQEVEAATVEQSSESPANQPEEQPQIPLLNNGEPDYNAMDARMFAEQYVARFGEGATERIARNNIKASNKTISTIEKQIEDVTDPNKMPALYSKLQEAQATKDKYSAVLEELGLSADESEDNAARIQRKKQENTPWFNKLFPDGFPNVESVILWDIANGNRIRWTNKEVNGAVVSKGLGSHLGLADSNAERTRRVALIGKDTPTPEEYAEQLPERLNAMGIRFEESELLDKVLDVYASVDTVRKAKEELEKISANIQAEQEGLDYEEEQMRRNYEREQEALQQEAQADVVDEQTEQEQPTNEEIQEEELSIEDEVPFMVSSDSVQTTNEAQQLATEAVITALEDAGVEVVNATPEMVEEALQRKDVQMQSVNQKFNEQLDSFTEENANAVIFNLGMPSPMLIAGGVPNKPIRLYGSKLLKKIRKHGFSATELRGLPMALANPIAVFDNYQREGNRSVLTELSTADGNFLVSIDIGMGTDIDFDIVKSVFGKDGDGILNWINKGYLTTVDKEKALAYLRISAPIAEASNKQELDSATKIVENFENPKIEPDNSFSIGSAPVFVSNAKIAVLGIKQEKATPEQWLKMIEKAGGLKAGEDKWIGLSDWLKASDKKTLTKQEVLGYINENQIQIEETTYSSNSAVETTPEFKALQEEFKQLVKSYEDKTQRNLDEYEAKLEKKYNFTDTFDTTVLNSDESKAHSSLSRAVGEAYNAAWVDLVDKYGDDFEIAFWRGYDGIRVDNAEAAGVLLGLPIDRPIYHLREDYTTKGLEGNREIALTVPTIESWNENDEVHFGDAGEGRAIAWARFGETTTPTDEAIAAKKAVEDYLASMREKYGSKEGEETDAMTADEISHLQSLTAKEIESREKGLRVLVIDEIQSKRHQEGREKGYISGDIKAGRAAAKKRLREAYDAAQEYRETLKEKYNWDGIEANSFSEHVQKFTALLTPEEIAERERLDEEKRKADEEWDKYDRVTGAVPEAPFEKNWAELAMKRMLRYAAEHGFDKVAWTKGDQQAERYNIGSVVDKIVSYTEDGAKTVRIYLTNNEPLNLKVDSEGKILYSNRLTVSAGQNLSDVVGKDVAVKILRGDGEDATIYAGKGKEYAAKQLSGNNLRIGGEGMRAFYDQMLPSFMRKYGKKWGATVQDVTLPYVEEAGRTMHSVDVTKSMRESVMQGQPMFYRRPNGIVYGWTNGTTVYLTESGMNPNTPIHEYTHIWAAAMRKHNPEGWKSIVKLLKGTPVWNEVMADTNYANIHSSENQVASEALSRISGRENSAKMEAMSQQMIDENANDTVKMNRARKLLDRMRKALQEFWSWVGKELFGIKNFESIEQVTDRILYDLVSGTDLAATPSLAGQVKAVIDEYDNADEVFTINDVAERISDVVNNYTGTESTTELENILEDFEEAQNSAGRYGYRMDSGGEDAFEEALRAYVAKAPIGGFSIQPQERAEIIRAAKANGTYLKAPNGKDTNLTPEQWVTVRTKAFKRWFGDWENDPENASKVVDENGEPWVVYHGTNSNFTKFDSSAHHAHDAGYYGRGFYFAFGGFSPKSEAAYYGDRVIEAFVRVKKPFLFSTLEEYKGHQISTVGASTFAFYYNIAKQFPELEGIVDMPISYSMVNDKKVANSPLSYQQYVDLVDGIAPMLKVQYYENIRGEEVYDIEYTTGKTVKSDNGFEWPETITIFRGVKNGTPEQHSENLATAELMVLEKYFKMDPEYHPEGIMTRNPEISDAIKSRRYDGILQSPSGDELVVFYPNQIKLAEGNTTFDPDNDDIRFSIERDNESEDDFSIVEYKVTPLARLEEERDALLENRENNPNFEQEYAAIEERIREERETDRVALTIVDGLESDAHRVAVEDAVFDYVREHNLFASQVYVVNSYEAFKEKLMELFAGADIEDLDEHTGAIYKDGIIVIRADAVNSRIRAYDRLIHEYTHALTMDQLYDPKYYRVMLGIAKQVGAEYMVERLYPNYEKLGIEKSDDGLVAGLMELVARDMEFVVRNGRFEKFLEIESSDESVLREYFERYNVPKPLTNLLIEIANKIKANKYEQINGERNYSHQRLLSATSLEDAGANLQPDAGVDGEGGLQFRGGLLQSREGVTADAGGQMGGGTRADRADLAESNQTAKSDSRTRLIAELRQKLRDVKAETRTVAAEVGKIVRKAITAELIDKMGKRTFDNIVRTIETATVRRDVEYAVNRIEEAVLDMELRDKQDKFDKYLNLRVQGESARGVSIAANVTDQVRQFITIIRDNLDRPASEVEALIEERGGSLAERTGLQVLGFYQDARNFEREVQEIEDEIEKIKSENTELRKKRAALNKAGKTNDAKNLSDQINDNKETIEHLNSERISTKRSQLYYIDMAANELEREIAYGKEGHKEWLQQEAERKQELIKIAWNDIRDGKKIPILDEQEPIWKKTKNAVVDFLLAPAYSWDYLLKMISVNAPNGEGALYDHFMRSENGYVAASGNYYQAYEDFKARLNEKAKDIFGKDYKQVLKDSNQPLDVTIQISAQYAKPQSTTDENKIREGASEIYTPTIGEVVYAYMAAKMPDGRVKLDKMGVKEDIIDYLVRQIPQGYITFADWVQNEFLPERRKVYNKTHLEVFGTQMAQIENYVPLKVKKDFVYEEFDGSKIDKAELPSSITGSIIKRKRNSLPIDLHTNIFDLLLDHGQQMEHWNAYTRIVRDTNQFLSNTQIRRALDYRKKGLHKKLKEAALIASNSYQPDVDRMEKMTVALSKMAASSKIAFRINTAIKQVLSYPAFYAYVADAHFWGYLTRNLGPDTWGRNFRWALDNIPSFQERWLGRMAGDDRLAQMTSPQLDRWIKGMGDVGMLPNALVDAVTCANGAQAVYRYEHERYLKIGLDESEADRLAKIAAAQALNQTQQSSEGMYLSRIQADRTAFAVAISTFQNSNFAYLRKELEGIDQLMRDTKKQIANREKYYEQQGVNPDQAAKLALQDVVSANRTAVVKILVFGFILNTIWTLGNSVWKYAFGDDDEEDKWEDAAIRGFFNSFTRNLSVGQYVETVAWSDFRELNPSLLLSDLNMFIERLESIAEGNVKMWDRTAAWTVLSTLSSLGLGVDINSFASMYEGVMGIMTSSHGVRLDADTAATIFRNSVGIRMSGGSVEDWMLFLNAPRSQAKFIAGPPKEGETLDEYTKRQAWIERKIVSRIDKKQLDKWSRNYEAYKQAEMLGVPYSRDKMGRVSVPYIKDIDDSYSALLKSVGRTKSGAKRNDGDSIADDVKTRIRDFGLIKRIKDINALEKNLDAMVILDGAYPERLKELCEAKQQLIEEWNQ